MNALLAVAGGWSLYEIANWLIIAVAVVAIIYVVCQVAGVKIPWWLVKILLIIAVAALAILGIGFLASL